MKNKKSNVISYIIIAAVLIIPFMYSFFYLSAYWNPYGEGNIDNLPVAIVNEDEGDKGEELINSIIESGKLKLSIVSETEASDGLYEGDYYAVITIPNDFTESMESASEENKKHATITYSPNQKSNYLASQIINTVILNVEKSLDNEINSTIIDTLSNKLESVPDSLEEISDGFAELNDGTSKLKSGASELNDGLDSLETSYEEFNTGLKTLSEGTNTLNESVSSLDSITEGIEELQTGISTLSNGADTLNDSLNSYVDGVNSTLTYTENLVDLINATICPKVTNNTASEYEKQMCAIAQGLSKTSESTGNTTVTNYLKVSGSKITTAYSSIDKGINTINTSLSAFNGIDKKITLLKTSISSINDGTNTLYQNSLLISDGITTLSDGANTLYNGICTLDESVEDAKIELDENVNNTKDELKTLEGLSEYAEEPISVEEIDYDKVNTYGESFAPLFISIALWVGALMMYVVLYYDKEVRFKKLSIDNNKHLERTLCYHGLATLSGLILGILLNTLLDFSITNYFLYYFVMILIANTFISIIEFLIVNFKDVGKFLALILLVLQLAASGGTFPIETVTSGFRFLNSLLPMTYTIKLLKEPLISIESSLLTKNLIIVLLIFIVFTGFNIIKDIIHDKKIINKM